ncbi:MAG: hypothetical protein ABI725_04235 [Chloroflexota bacterium]
MGGLPIDQPLRSDQTCLLCHDLVTEGGATFAPSPGVQSLVPLTRYPLAMRIV